MKTIDVGYVIDEGRWTTYQKLLILGAALTIILDGVDNQLLGNAVPSLMKEWSLPRGAFSTILALSPFGMMIGGAVGGILGDRIGRRTALLFSMLSFAVLTLAISTVNGLMLLGAFRFLAGLGLGGAMPNAAALSSEYVPRRQRPFAVTLTIVCIPLGGSLAGLVGGQVLPRFGWRGLFLVGGILPLVMAAVLLKVLPESPRYLGRRHRRRDRARVHDDRPAVPGGGPRHAGVDRRPHQRRSNDDVRAGRACVSDRRARHRRRNGGGVRPHRRRAEPIGRIVGARNR